MTQARGQLMPAHGRVLVAIAGQLEAPGWFAVWAPGAERPVLLRLPHPHRRDGRGPGLFNAVRDVVGEEFDRLLEIRIVLEGQPKIRRVSGLRTLLDDPRVVVDRPPRRDVLAHLGLPAVPMPDEAEIMNAVATKTMMKTTNTSTSIAFWQAWVSAVALAGAARAWGTTTLPKPQPAASRRRRAHEQVGEHRDDRNPCRPAPAALSLAQVAEQLGVDRTTAYRLAERKAFASFRVGRQIRVHREDLETFVARTRQPSSEETAQAARGKLVVLPRVSLAEDDEAKGHRLADALGLK